MAHIRQSRPGSGIGFQVKVLEPFQDVLSSLGRGFQGFFQDRDETCRIFSKSLDLKL